MVRAVLPTPPSPSTTSLYSVIRFAMMEPFRDVIFKYDNMDRENKAFFGIRQRGSGQTKMVVKWCRRRQRLGERRHSTRCTVVIW